MRALIVILFLLGSFSTSSASTLFQGKIRNLTGYKNEEIKIKISRYCDWFCDVTNWVSAEVAIKADGTWSIKSPHSSAGYHSIIVSTPKARTVRSIYYDEYNQKIMENTLIETLPARIPVKLSNGQDAGPWLREVVAGRKLDLNETLSLNQDFRPRPLPTKTLNDSFLQIPETLFIYGGFQDATYKSKFASLFANDPKYANYPHTKAYLEREGNFGRDFYSSISEFIVDNSLDNPVFDGEYSGDLVPLQSWEMGVTHYPDMRGLIQSKCRNGVLSGSFIGEYIDRNRKVNSGIKFSLPVAGTCGLGRAKFTVHLQLPPKGADSPDKQTFEVASDEINGKRIYFFGYDSKGRRFNGHFWKE